MVVIILCTELRFIAIKNMKYSIDFYSVINGCMVVAVIGRYFGIYRLFKHSKMILVYPFSFSDL